MSGVRGHTPVPTCAPFSHPGYICYRFVSLNFLWERNPPRCPISCPRSLQSALLGGPRHGRTVRVASAVSCCQRSPPTGLTGFKRTGNNNREGNASARRRHRNILGRHRKSSKRKYTEILDRRSGLRMSPGNGRTRCVLTLAYVSLRLLT